MTYNAIEDALRLPTLLDLFNVDETSVCVLRRVNQLVEFDDCVTRQHAMLELSPVADLFTHYSIQNKVVRAMTS